MSSALPPGVYIVDPLDRLPDLDSIIAQRGYFVFQAPRQMGKTTSLIAYAKKLTEDGKFASTLLSMQPGGPLSRDVGQAEAAVLEEWRNTTEWALPKALQPPQWPVAEAGGRIRAALSAWAKACPRPLVLFLDEIDALEGITLASVLTQLRAGHPSRPRAFPWSVALVGMRDVRD